MSWPTRKNVEMQAQYRFELNNPIEIHLTDHCNMNCMHCAHYSPIAEPRYVTMQELAEALNVLKIIKPRRVHLLGGEPLLHPEIDKILEFFGINMPRGAEVFLVTNGTLLGTMSETFWNLIKNYDIKILLSIYPARIDYQDLINYVKSKGVNLKGLDQPRIRFRAIRLTEDKLQDQNHSYSSCKVKCLQIRDGRIYPCSYSAYFEHLNKIFNTSFRHIEGDYLRLGQIRNGTQVSAWMDKPKPFCAHCNCGKETLVRWDFSSRHNSDEWIETGIGV